MFYESIMELDDVKRPSYSIIEDDEACDRWHNTFTQEIREKLIEQAEQREGKKQTIPMKASRSVADIKKKQQAMKG